MKFLIKYLIKKVVMDSMNRLKNIDYFEKKREMLNIISVQKKLNGIPNCIIDLIYKYGVDDIANMLSNREFFQSVVCNQNIYIIGGSNRGSRTSYRNVETYDMSTNIWTPVSNMLTSRVFHGVSVLKDANKEFIYSVGGFDTGNIRKYVLPTVLSDVEKYDYSLNIWTTVCSMTISRMRHGVCVMTETDGKQFLYAIGGCINEIQVSPSVEKYDQELNRWTRVADMNIGRKNHKVAVVTDKNGKQFLYAIGGDNDSGILQSVEKYDYELNTWTLVSNIKQPRTDFNVVVINNCLHIVGGYVGMSFIYSIDKYDPISNDWKQPVAYISMLKHLTNVLVVTLDGKPYLYTLGGYDGSGLLKSVDRYIPVGGKWC